VFAPPTAAVGAPVNIWFLKCTVGKYQHCRNMATGGTDSSNISTAGIWLPVALTAAISALQEYG